MNKRQFKAGDLVYYPQMGCGIFSLQAVRKSIMYPIKICRENGFEEFLTADGKLYDHDQAAMIFHATPENQQLLEQLHGIKLQDAPVAPTSKEIVQGLLGNGQLYVPCWASDSQERPVTHNQWIFVNQIIDGDYPFIDEQGNSWRYATPFDIQTGDAITELTDD